MGQGRSMGLSLYLGGNAVAHGSRHGHCEGTRILESKMSVEEKSVVVEGQSAPPAEKGRIGQRREET
jgi:hypothetical protein